MRLSPRRKRGDGIECKDAKISIRHLYYASSPNSPNSVEFPANRGPIQLKKGSMTLFVNSPWRYIAFLKRNSDGTYVPSVDAFDSALCFLNLTEPHIIAKLAEPPAETKVENITK